MKSRMTGAFDYFFFSLIFSILVFLFPCESRSAGDFDVTLLTSRTEGIAPLSVFFDATQTPELADGSYLDATFAWDFDMDDVDPGARFKNASGFVAAHVFENPGTYRVRVDVYDSLGRKAYEEVTINVLPFTGVTYYVAGNGSDTNTGTTMDDPIQTLAHALLDLARPNTRILFRKGDTFYTADFIGATDRSGPVIVAGYEDPDSPSDQAPIICNTAVNGPWATLYPGSDWRVMDLNVRAGGSAAGEAGTRYPGGIGFGGGTSNSLIYRVEQHNVSNQWMDPYGQYNTVAECNIHEVSGTGYSSGGDGGAIIGNWVHDKGPEDPEHVYRLQGGSRYFIAFNNFEGNVVNYDSLTIRGNTEKVVIYKNTLDRVTGIWPQVRDLYDETQRYCILDSNLFIGRVNPPNYNNPESVRQLAIGLHAKDIVIRNNVIYNYNYGINVENDTVVGPSRRIKIYNNTYINDTPGGGCMFVNVDPGCFDIEVKNNLILDNAGSDPLYTRIVRVRSGGATFNGTSNNNLFFGNSWNQDTILFNSYNLAQWQAATGHDLNSRMQNPNLASLEIESANFVLPLSNDSPPVNAGLLTGAALDYNGNLRDMSRDIGAVEYISGVADAESPGAPVGLTAASSSSSEIDLSWSASTDNIGVAGYRIYRNGIPVATTTDTTFRDSGCAPATTCDYTIRAYDAAGNISLPSNVSSAAATGQGVGATGQGADGTVNTGGGGGGGCFIAAVM